LEPGKKISDKKTEAQAASVFLRIKLGKSDSVYLLLFFPLRRVKMLRIEDPALIGVRSQ